MRNFIKLMVAVVFLLSNLLCNAQSIVYEPFGSMDKPLPAIEIKIKKNKDLIDHYRNHAFRHILFVSRKNFRKLKRYVKQKNTAVQYVPMNYDNGTYRVAYEDGRTRVEYMLNRVESKQFFEEQLQLVTPNNNVYDKLKLIILRL